MTKKIFFTCLLLFISHFVASALDTWIRINQLGYLPAGIKKAVLISENPLKITSFTIHDALTDKEIAKLSTVQNFGQYENFKSVYTLNFSTIKAPGAYYIKTGIYYSPTIYINNNIYNQSSDLILNYFRQQHCGYNPVTDITCHGEDGLDGIKNFVKTEIIDKTPKDKNALTKKTKENTTKKSLENSAPPVIEISVPVFNKIDVTGGWHTGYGFTKNGALTANAVFNMLMAWQMSPDVFGDRFNKYGLPGKNGIPDILDEAKWGMDWLIKMNPANGQLYHQVGDDRDEIPGLTPEKDSLNYGYGTGNGRHIFKATGKPQGLFSTQNNSTGLASIAGKYATVFALGADVFHDIDYAFADSLENLAVQLYQTGKNSKGVTQSVPGKSGKYMMEDNWSDDMELAATQLYQLTFSGKYLQDAVDYGRMEPVSPWAFTDSTKYYQWYPFTNFGHLNLIKIENPAVRNEFVQDIQTNLKRADEKKNKSPFLVTTPMSEGSSNFVVSLATQCQLYRKFTGDSAYIDLETALTDWLFGCNPWGISMMVGWPENGYTPTQPACNQFISKRIIPTGALINGPVEKSVFQKSINSNYFESDNMINSGSIVYHNNSTDNITNTPSFDGSAALLFYLASKQAEINHPTDKIRNTVIRGGIVRTDSTRKVIQLVFTGHAYADGGKYILKALRKNRIKASFFVTGDFLRNKNNAKLIARIIKDGHYIGPYSDKYLLCTTPTQPHKLVVNKQEFINDLKNNYLELENSGIKHSDALIFYPAGGYYNDSISRWCRDYGVTLVAPTPGINSVMDISTPPMRENYFSSIEIYNQMLKYERKYGLNGKTLMFHMGVDKKRTDKFYKRISSLISDLKQKGYTFQTMNQALDNNKLVKNNQHKKK